LAVKRVPLMMKLRLHDFDHVSLRRQIDMARIVPVAAIFPVREGRLAHQQSQHERSEPLEHHRLPNGGDDRIVAIRAAANG
jgi:hypothetical protein